MPDACPMLRGMYNENDSSTQVLYVKNAVATFSSVGAPSETVESLRVKRRFPTRR